MKKFIQGILFISLLLPIIEGILSLFNQIIKYFCTYIAVKTYNLEKSIEEKEETSNNPIGFQSPPIIEDYEDEDEGE